MREFHIVKSDGGRSVVRCNSKREANKLAKEAEKLLGWKIVKVEEFKRKRG